MDERDRGQKPYYPSDEGARAAFDPSYRGLHQYDDDRDLGRFRRERELHGMGRRLGESSYDPQQRSEQAQRYSYRDWERDHERRVNDRGLQGGYGENDRGFGFDPNAAKSKGHHESWGHDFVDNVKRMFRGPKGYKRSDDRIREDVYERLTRQQLLDAHEIEVSVSKGEVTLSGSVPSREEKFHAEQLADAVSGVEDVHNRLRIAREQDSERGVLGTAVQKSANTLGLGKR